MNDVGLPWRFESFPIEQITQEDLTLLLCDAEDCAEDAKYIMRTYDKDNNKIEASIRCKEHAYNE